MDSLLINCSINSSSINKSNVIDGFKSFLVVAVTTALASNGEKHVGENYWKATP